MNFKIVLILLLTVVLFPQNKDRVVQPVNDNDDLREVIRKYELLVEKYPDKKELFYNLGNLNYFAGDKDAAIQNYKNSLI